jgi:hypothetical protein
MESATYIVRTEASAGLSETSVTDCHLGYDAVHFLYLFINVSEEATDSIFRVDESAGFTETLVTNEL